LQTADAMTSTLALVDNVRVLAADLNERGWSGAHIQLGAWTRNMKLLLHNLLVARTTSE